MVMNYCIVVETLHHIAEKKYKMICKRKNIRNDDRVISHITEKKSSFLLQSCNVIDLDQTIFRVYVCRQDLAGLIIMPKAVYGYVL